MAVCLSGQEELTLQAITLIPNVNSQIGSAVGSDDGDVWCHWRDDDGEKCKMKGWGFVPVVPFVGDFEEWRQLVPVAKVVAQSCVS